MQEERRVCVRIYGYKNSKSAKKKYDKWVGKACADLGVRLDVEEMEFTPLAGGPRCRR